MTFDPAEGSATGNLRDLRDLCGGKNARPPDPGMSTGRGGFSTTEVTEVTEALGSLTSHTAGLRIRFNVLCWFTKFRGQPRRRCRSRVERIETAIEFLCVLASLR